MKSPYLDAARKEAPLRRDTAVGQLRGLMRITKRFAALCLAASALCISPTQAGSIFVGALQLHERDMNGDGRVDAYFDSVFGVTWLRDWHYVHTRQPTIPGLVNWPTAKAFAEFAGTDMRFDPLLAGRTRWRVPTLREFVLIFDALPYMQNVQEGYYWSADVYPPVPELSWAFQPLGVSEPSAAVLEYTELHHVALVRDGDVPEPSSLALAAVVLLGGASARRSLRRNLMEEKS